MILHSVHIACYILTSSSAAIVSEIVSGSMESQSLGKLVITTCCPVMPLPLLAFGQSFIRWPPSPQVWQTLAHNKQKARSPPTMQEVKHLEAKRIQEHVYRHQNEGRRCFVPSELNKVCLLKNEKCSKKYPHHSILPRPWDCKAG